MSNTPPKRFTCRISRIDYYNHDTRRVLLQMPPGETADFRAGQYLQVILPDKKCPFSIASSPRIREQLELHVRPTPGSEDSVAVEALLDQGTELEIELPLGDCYITGAPTTPLLLVAASTGITQMKSIIEFLMPDGFAQPIHLYWGVLSARDLYCSDLCYSWQAEHNNFHFTPVVSEPESSPNWQGRTGLVGDIVLADFDSLTGMTAYISGGPAMVYATCDAFMARGLPESSIFSDIFSYSPRYKKS